jgi:SWI/SNF-related matrix-associated actin-dependent regulator 1 of chromatin subfamily A
VTVPYPFQLRGVRQLHHFSGRALLADEQGLGKTFQTYLYCSRHLEQKPVVVVCPASLKFVWEREARRHFGWRAEVLSGTKPPGVSLALSTASLVVLNYDILWPWIPWLKNLKPKLVVLDECQYISGRHTKRTKGVEKLCEGVPHVLALSGTPLTNRPAELFPTLHLLRPDLFPSFYPYGHRYCGAKRNPFSGGMDYKGSSNLEELHKILLENLMVRRRKVDVLKELPSKTRCVVPLELPDYGEYNRALEDFLGWLGERKPDRLSSAERAERLVRVGYLLRLAGEEKLPLTIQWADGFLKECDRKLVIFAVHKEVISKLRKHFGKGCVVVDGSTSLKNRRAAVDAFQGSRGCRVFIGNIKAAGKGLTLTAASDVAFAELDWTPGAHLQAEDRAHRIGSKEAVFIHYLVAKGTIEEHLVELLQSKQGTLSAVLDGGSRGEDLDIFDRLTERLGGNR